ncbi:leucine-rich repeat domain-containing protein [Rickettsiales endosymbiont of Stachyamoeba lipophora]|uniref:hypothetical protein n=1 Tax=Rickettsiales endosymbiont of Stachyamoeba lipophora TaxID=2486578 RepID=UPI000F64A25E|nr:hypothetical protein [Rickettsiales endosymbiont of Stachyamoeba lipophora]AZL15173.1 hypothetical protein EF513_01180 [Rickettsiales endosymbiont of Stachyamoeba lipophora]
MSKLFQVFPPFQDSNVFIYRYIAPVNLDEYFNNLKLQLNANATLKLILDLHELPLKKAELIQILEFIQTHKQVIGLKLGNNNLQHLTIKLIATLLKDNAHLQYFEWHNSNNYINHDTIDEIAFKQLIAALNSCCSLRFVKFYKILTKESLTQIFVKNFNSHSLVSLDLREIAISAEDTTQLIELIGNMTQAKKLKIISANLATPQTDEQALKLFEQNFAKLKQLEHLILDNCKLDDAHLNILCNLICSSKVGFLSLKQNNFTEKATTTVANLISANNPDLRIVDFTENEELSNNASQFLSALKDNHYLMAFSINPPIDASKINGEHYHCYTINDHIIENYSIIYHLIERDDDNDEMSLANPSINQKKFSQLISTLLDSINTDCEAALLDPEKARRANHIKRIFDPEKIEKFSIFVAKYEQQIMAIIQNNEELKNNIQKKFKINIYSHEELDNFAKNLITYFKTFYKYNYWYLNSISKASRQPDINNLGEEESVISYKIASFAGPHAISFTAQTKQTQTFANTQINAASSP